MPDKSTPPASPGDKIRRLNFLSSGLFGTRLGRRAMHTNAAGPYQLTTHGSVTNLLQEHRQVLRWLQSRGIETLDMETMHIVRALRESDAPVDLNMVLYISDMPTSTKYGAHALTGTQKSQMNKKRKAGETNEVIKYLGILE